ncbi:MAG: bifunctional diaminohydroxyphosphoribosylaminopyrimidine deaminase/5-amino-6-(5-phosphoribosylamino)uracil reductase RibD, partial [Nitrospirota bacterium]|nr:bifunctional diaminohydroxyphosphoribosylaminopyrimidine deaminase/5-amino-6-(5-phosphoribosylamino)uracil reductase RibD [Nitrospirota bacterium]
EILALHRAGPRARGGVLYVTLEPCFHSHKRTPPCVPLLIQSALSRVCVAMPDPNPQVTGRGIRALQQAGIDVLVGMLETEARQLNEVYIHWMTTGRPFLILKGAMTLDGKIATHSGQSKWITGEKARQDVHRVRSQVDAVMVGIGTVLADNPELSARGSKNASKRRAGRQPVRVVLDSQLRIPIKANVLKWIHEQPTIVCTSIEASPKKIHTLNDRGIQVWVLPQKNGRVSLKAALTKLGKAGMSTVLLEGGSSLNASALHEGLVNQVQLYIAPHILGGQDAKSLIGGNSPKTLDQAWRLVNPKLKKMGQDWLVTGNIDR